MSREGHFHWTMTSPARRAVRRWAAAAALLSIALGGRVAAAQPTDDAPREDRVIAALDDCRNVRADLFVPHSSVLGDLPGPAGLAAAQPQFRELFSCPGPQSIDFTPEQRAQIKRDYTHYSFAGNPRSATPTSLGVTGAYVDSLDLRHELFVSAVIAGTPAAGKLQPDDVIIGANGRLFEPRRDPRLPMGYALYESTTPRFGGKLVLQVVRAGDPMNIEIHVPVLPPYAESWPYDCERSKIIADDMLKLVMSYDTNAGRGPWWPLFLMASGDDAALELARRRIYGYVKDEYPTELTGHSWGSSYRLIALCEYYLLTGDSKVLGAIDYHRAVLQAGQSRAGGWGHSCPCAGYGEVNEVGLAAMMGLALSRECGLKMDKVALAQSLRYHARFIGAGVPYGDHNSGMRAGAGNNGKAGEGVLAYKFFGLDDTARRWARAVAYMYLQPEAGHAEGIFNLAWDPLAAALAPRPEFAMHMNNLLWYYELARTHEGGLRFFRGGHFGYPVGQTTALGLVYMLPRKKIYLTGASKSVFAMTPPDDAMADAAMYYRRKNWATLKSVLTKYLADTAAQHKDYARKLMDAYERMETNATLTIKLAEQNIRDEKLYRAQQQLLTLGRVLGQQRPEMVALLKKIPANPYHARTNKGLTIDPKVTIFAAPPEKPALFEWEKLLPMAQEARRNPQGKCKVYRPGKAGDRPAGEWFAPKYNTAGWLDTFGQQTLRAGQDLWVRRTFSLFGVPKQYKMLLLKASNCQGELYLNGYKLADFGPGDFYLGSSGASAVRQGNNVLAVHLVSPQGQKTASADLSLLAATDLQVPQPGGPLPDLNGPVLPGL